MSVAKRNQYNEDMSNFVTKLDLKVAIDDVLDTVNQLGDRMGEEILRLDAKIDKLGIGLRAEMKNNHNEIMSLMDSFIKRTTTIEDENILRDAQLGRHERWLHEVAKKTDAKLTY